MILKIIIKCLRALALSVHKESNMRLQKPDWTESVSSVFLENAFFFSSERYVHTFVFIICIHRASFSSSRSLLKFYLKEKNKKRKASKRRSKSIENKVCPWILDWSWRKTMDKSSRAESGGHGTESAHLITPRLACVVQSGSTWVPGKLTVRAGEKGKKKICEWKNNETRQCFKCKE